MVTATVGSSQAAATILVAPGSAPVLKAPRRQLVKINTAVDFVVQASDPAGLPLQLTAQGIPTGAAFDPASGTFHWTPQASQAGSYNVTFTAVNSANQSASTAVPVEVGTGAPALDDQALSCSPGAIAGLTGKWLAADGSVLADATGGSLSLGGTQVEVNGTSVPVLFSSSTSVKFLCPAVPAGTALSVNVRTASGSSAALSGTMQEATPAILTLDGSGPGQGLVRLGGTANLAMYRNFRTQSQPAQPGDEIQIVATGLGTDASAGRVEVNISGVDATADSVTPVSGQAGLYSIQAHVPAGVTFGNAVPLEIRVVTPDGSQFTSAGATITVEPFRR